MKTDVIIRRAVANDLEAIGCLWQEFMDFHRERDSHFTRATDGHERFKKFISGHIASDNSCVLVAEKEGSVVGYCLAILAKYPPVFDKRDHGVVFDLAVTERYRRSGVGEKMYHTVQSWFSGRGVHRIELRVAVTNETSTAFWRKMGFKPYVETVFKTI
jgi:ribosomal protein S18 acetylase RimI-like enzyme